ncbi:hypothetical protein F8388_024890 [Cannabis sativa]|uniref:Uncharacterized protein n=1 Tax=Cannabis sativa TaxID=3483 RepID=A0A7J6H914_CANSA|nr:hypothetical protein F8388_024890 [Cannabis sativa]
MGALGGVVAGVVTENRCMWGGVLAGSGGAQGELYAGRGMGVWGRYNDEGIKDKGKKQLKERKKVAAYQSSYMIPAR